MVWVSNLGRGKRFFSSVKCTNQLCSLSSFLLSAYWDSFPGVNWQWHGGNQSPPSHTKVKNEWSQNCLLLHAFIVWGGTAALYLYSSKNRLCELPVMGCISYQDVPPLCQPSDCHHHLLHLCLEVNRNLKHAHWYYIFLLWPDHKVQGFYEQHYMGKTKL